jgi:hypothetical protein
MIVVRDIFRLKFGQSKDAVNLWKQAMTLLTSCGIAVRGARLLTDLAGPAFYTVILESTYDSLSDWEKAHEAAKGNAAWREVYSKILPLTESGHREVLSVLA